MWQGTNCDFLCIYYSKTRGSFLERPGNFSGPKANFKTQNLLNSCTVPGPQTSQFYFGTDSSIVLFSKLLKTLILNANIKNTKYFSFLSPKRYRDFRETGPRSVDFSTYPDKILFAKFEKLYLVYSEPVHVSVVYKISAIDTEPTRSDFLRTAR